jgi:hypothetical protein
MGNIELVDQVTVVKHLAKQGLVDLARVRQQHSSLLILSQYSIADADADAR